MLLRGVLAAQKSVKEYTTAEYDDKKMFEPDTPVVIEGHLLNRRMPGFEPQNWNACTGSPGSYTNTRSAFALGGIVRASVTPKRPHGGI